MWDFISGNVGEEPTTNKHQKSIVKKLLKIKAENNEQEKKNQQSQKFVLWKDSQIDRLIKKKEEDTNYQYLNWKMRYYCNPKTLKVWV